MCILSNKCYAMAVFLSIQCKEDISAKYFEHTKPCTVANNLLRLFCFRCSFPTKIIISEKVYTLDLAAMVDTYFSLADIGINLLCKVDLHYGLFVNNF